MKPIIKATIALAGVLATAGAASVVTAEYSAVKAGQQAVASLFGDQPKITIDASSPVVASNDDFQLASHDAIQRKMDETLTARDSISPEVSVQSQQAHTISLTRHEPRTFEYRIHRASERHASIPPAVPAKPALSLTAHSLPTPDQAKGYKFYYKSGDKPLITLTSLHALPVGAVALDARKISWDQKEWTKNMKELSGKQWKEIPAVELKHLQDIGVTISANADGTPGVVTVDPAKAAAFGQRIEQRRAQVEAQRSLDSQSDFDQNSFYANGQ